MPMFILFALAIKFVSLYLHWQRAIYNISSFLEYWTDQNWCLTWSDILYGLYLSEIWAEVLMFLYQDKILCNFVHLRND